ncbi:MAG: aspartate aminotransferase family protein [Bryobacteraceae bacterium]|nr:aspartate aminotransferase family protein [Bryobacteraceae bacterium]
MTKQEILHARRERLFPAELHYYGEPLVITHAKGAAVFDIDGKQYIDFFGGILVISVGHCNDEVNARIQRQLDTLAHTSTLFATQPPVELASKIARLSPGGKLAKCFFSNSGTEANEMAVLAARAATGASEIVALRYGYHGRSGLAMSMSGQSTWRVGTQPSPGFAFAHNAYCYRCPHGLEYPSCDVRCANDVEDVIRTQTSGRPAAFIAEPIQGAGGFITPPKEYFARVAEIVRRRGGLFIADEVQTAWGRTGTWFGIEHWGVQPDIITSAKGMGNGFPVAMTAVRADIADRVPKMTISTFGGSPLAAEAANAVIDYIEKHNLPAHAARQGAYLRERLERLKAQFPLIGDVRGMGLMQALELVKNRQSREPAVEETAKIMELGRERGILFGEGGLDGNVLRLAPPLTITRAEIDEFLSRLENSFAAIK